MLDGDGVRTYNILSVQWMLDDMLRVWWQQWHLHPAHLCSPFWGVCCAHPVRWVCERLALASITAMGKCMCHRVLRARHGSSALRGAMHAHRA